MFRHFSILPHHLRSRFFHVDCTLGVMTLWNIIFRIWVKSHGLWQKLPKQNKNEKNNYTLQQHTHCTWDTPLPQGSSFVHPMQYTKLAVQIFNQMNKWLEIMKWSPRNWRIYIYARACKRVSIIAFLPLPWLWLQLIKKNCNIALPRSKSSLAWVRLKGICQLYPDFLKVTTKHLTIYNTTTFNW